MESVGMDVYENAARIIAESKNLVAFTGAGVSAEAGIPTFRDPGGIWDQFDPAEFGTVEGIVDLAQRKPESIRQFLLNTVDIFRNAKPNPAHVALAELESMGILKAVITQNIDNLHGDAGNEEVLEMHGNLFRVRCTRCGRRYSLNKEEFLQKAKGVLSVEEGFGLDKVIGLMPACDCGGMTRPDVVMFGEAVQRLNQSFRAGAAADTMLVLGTSGVVYPAGAIPHQAHETGTKIIEINPSENSYSGISEVYIQEAAGEAMPKVMELVRKRVG